METINEASRRCWAEYGTGIASFKRGVDFAQQWISVENDLPPSHEKGDWDGKRSDFVISIVLKLTGYNTG